MSLRQTPKLLTYGPSEIAVFDFDERICGAVTRFADKERLTQLKAGFHRRDEAKRKALEKFEARLVQ